VSLEGEVFALRSSAGWWRGDHVAVIHVDGAGAFDLLEHASTQPLYLREGRVRHTLLLRDDASIFADVFIGSADDGFYVLAEGPSETDLVAWLEGVKGRRPGGKPVAIRGLSETFVTLGVDGPYAWEVVSELLGRVVLGMPYLSLLRRGDVLCLRAGKTGEYGYMVLIPRSSASDLEARLAEVGRPLGLVAVGREALDVCALENWHFSIRIQRDTPLVQPLTPIELQLQWRVVYEKDFVGVEALRTRRAEGANFRTTCFVADGPLSPGQPLRLGGEDAGEVLASCFSPTLGAGIGAALLSRRIAHPHVALSASAGAGVTSIKTCTTPLVDNLSMRIDPHKHSYLTRDSLPPRPEPR
jgi:glycine cleavage system aminomethyltransferase T